MRTIFVLLICLTAASVQAAIPTFGTGTTNTSTSEDTARTAKPPSVSSGNLVILLVVGDEDNPGSGQWTTPTDFLKIFEGASNGSDIDVAAFYKVAGASEPDSYFVENTGGASDWVIWALLLSGQHATPLEATGTPVIQNVGTTLTLASTSTTHDSCLAFAVYGFDGADGTPSTEVGTSWTQRSELVAGSLGNGVTAAYSTRSLPSLGSSGSSRAAWNTSDGSAGCQFVIRGTVVGPADARNRHQVWIIE